MPAAAVIPAPIAYIKVVAVKKLVVGFRSGRVGPPFVVCLLALVVWLGCVAFTGSMPLVCRPCRVYCVASDRSSPSETESVLNRVGFGCEVFTLKKLECSKQASILA